MRLDPGMKLALAVLATAACHKTPALRAHTDPATLITSDVTGIMRSSSAESPILQYAHQLIHAACTKQIDAKLHDAYQVDIAGHNYFLFEGDVSRGEVESCLANADLLKTSHDGDLLVIDALGGHAYVGWRGDVIVAGSKAQVTAALAQHDATLARTWHDRIAALPPGKLAMMTQQPVFDAFLGVPTHGMTLSADVVGPHRFVIHFVIECADQAGAEAARRQIATGQVPPGIDPPPDIKAGFQKLKPTVNGARLDVVIDQDTFTNVDLPMLQRWFGEAKQGLLQRGARRPVTPTPPSTAPAPASPGTATPASPASPG